MGIDLCRHIKHSRPNQQVALVLGDRAGIVSRRFDADAVFAGDPTVTQLVAALRLLVPDVQPVPSLMLRRG